MIQVDDFDGDCPLGKKLAPPSLVHQKIRDPSAGDRWIVVFDETNIVLKAGSCEAILALLAVYYTYNIQYPRIYSQLLGFLQTFLIKDTPFDGEMTKGFKALSSSFLNIMK